jgi:hypothetical protein
VLDTAPLNYQALELSMAPTTRATMRAQLTADQGQTDQRATMRIQHTAEQVHTDQQAELLHTAVSDHTGQGTLPTNVTETEHSHGPALPRTSSAGTGRYTVDTSRIIANLNLDSSTPISNDPLRRTNPVHPPQMVSCHYDAMVHVLRKLGANQDEEEAWAMAHICDERGELDALPDATKDLLQKAERRVARLFPHLTPPNADTTEATANAEGMPIVSRQQSATATLCTNGARLAISYPPKFKPDKTNWFLWRPQVEIFFFRIKLDPRILLARHDTAINTGQHATALSIMTEISPDSESEWIARLNFTRAYQAWEELERAFAPRAELELQAKLEDLEPAHQTETDSIREWTLRLRRLMLEIQAMNEHAVTDTVHKLNLLRIKPIIGSEDGFNNYVATIRHSLPLKSVQQVEHELIAHEEGTQMQARLNGNSIPHLWHTRAGGHSSQSYLPTAQAFQRPTARGVCYICYNARPTPPSDTSTMLDHMQNCSRRDTPLGRLVMEIMDTYRAARKLSKVTKPGTKPSTSHFEPTRPKKRPGTF